MKTNQSLKNLTPDATLSQIKSADGKAAELLASIGLEPSNHKNETLRSVCQQRKWSEVEVLKWIKKHSPPANNDASKNGMEPISNEESSLKEWTEHLEETFINPNLSLLKERDENFPRIHKIHGNQYPWLKNMEWHFNQFEETLSMYYEFERKKFFPLINRLENVKKGDINHGTIQKLQKSFAVIEKDQDRLQRLMADIREKGNEFENPPNACSTLRIQNENFNILFSRLEEQLKTENDQLIPRVKEEMNSKI